MQRLGTETAFEVLAKARALEAQGRHIVHLEIGEPDFDTPPAITAAGIEALRSGETHYTPSAGIPELRAAIAKHVSRTRGVPADAANVVVTPGAKPIMFYAVLALLDEGDEAIVPDPGFPIYASMVQFVGAKVTPLPLREENEFGVDVDELRRLITPQTKLLILNSPHNPTGGVLSAEQVRAIAAIAAEHDLYVLSDEIYGELLYEGEFVSPWAEPGMRDRTILLDGFSKTFAMTGWRLGYGVFPKMLVDGVTKLVTNSVSCTATFTQRAGVEALERRPQEVAAMVREFRRRRDRIVAGLNEIEGVSCVMPRGAFYAFPNVKRLGMRSAALNEALLNEAGVACLAGTAFGPLGEGYLRLSYANSLENIEEALRRFSRWVREQSAVRA
ncbi:MAG TPA: pyridoxal phosphate-dependent aminotransferase [Candidatus Dormibacteraeota bacterium]|jgi:aspartate/methionine/tyrosine aminotransferase|nr:pyridoxal phosphate-dependent aminotransferase [Candidatus Dormibacteraeota bacterium]